MDLATLLSIESKCSEKSKLSEKVMPRVLRLVTRLRPTSGGGMEGWDDGNLGLLTIISNDFDTLSFRLLVVAQTDIASSSDVMVSEWLAGTSKSVSSAYLRNAFAECSGWRSDAFKTKVDGPSPDP